MSILTTNQSADGNLFPPTWDTDSGNRMGTAHLYVRVADGEAVSACGRRVLMDDLQETHINFGRCKRCAGSATAKWLQAQTSN